MKATIFTACATLAATAFPLSAATVTILPVTPYRSLNDSPWRDAIVAGDALKFGDQFCNFPATTLPNGLGVHDNFEDDDCLSPWLQIKTGRVFSGASVDSDDGFLNETSSGRFLAWDFVAETQRIETELTFIPTSDGKFPLWVGFVVIGAGTSPEPAMMDLLGINGMTFASVNITSLVGNYRDARLVSDDVFVGFLSSEPIRAVSFYNFGVTLDHFQYGYGAQPIPEPAASAFAAFAVAAAGAGRRRRRR